MILVVLPHESRLAGVAALDHASVDAQVVRRWMAQADRVSGLVTREGLQIVVREADNLIAVIKNMGMVAGEAGLVVDTRVVANDTVRQGITRPIGDIRTRVTGKDGGEVGRLVTLGAGALGRRSQTRPEVVAEPMIPVVREARLINVYSASPEVGCVRRGYAEK